MKEIKIHDDQLILKEEYDECNVILTAYFSSSIEKNLLHKKITIN